MKLRGIFIILLLLLLSYNCCVFGDVPIVEFNNCSVCDSESGFDCGILCGHIKSYGFFNRNLLLFIAKLSFFWSSVVVFILDIILLYTIFFMVYRTCRHRVYPNQKQENLFRQLRLNQWVKQSIRWMPMDKWSLCSYPVDKERLKGRICYGGLDLSSTTDITAFVLVFPPEDEDGKYEILPFFWLPEETLALRVRRDHVPYDVWERQGFLQTTEGNVVHYGYIESFIERLGERYNIREIAFDRWGAVQMVQNLEGMGFTVVPFGQGFKDMSPPTKELMKLGLEERIAHGGNPVLRWMMDNIYIRTDPAGNIKPDKAKSAQKIDGIVAAIMALGEWMTAQADEDNNPYNQRGMLSL